MKLVEFIYPELVCTDLTSNSKMDVLQELGALLANINEQIDGLKATEILVERERLATTGVGEGIAIPHGKLEGLEKIVAAVGVSKTGIPFDAVDGLPVNIFVALLAPLDSSGDHLRALARISRLLKDPSIRQRMIQARSKEALFEVILVEDQKH